MRAASPQRSRRRHALLDSRKEIRRSAALALLPCAGMLTPVALRRLIVARSWLPEDERHFVDQVVRAARVNGVDCAPWPTPPTSVEIYTSEIDGSAAQGFLLITPEKRRFRVSSVLCRRGVGVLDAWVGDATPRREIDRLLRQARDQTPMLAVGREYLDRALADALHAGLTSLTVPPIGLLQVAGLSAPAGMASVAAIGDKD
ncbi:hypothetical protein CCP2SC5_1350004 [Azospirillaceae bacterium]